MVSVCFIASGSNSFKTTNSKKGLTFSSLILHLFCSPGDLKSIERATHGDVQFDGAKFTFSQPLVSDESEMAEAQARLDTARELLNQVTLVRELGGCKLTRTCMLCFHVY